MIILTGFFITAMHFINNIKIPCEFKFFLHQAIAPLVAVYNVWALLPLQ